MQCPFIQPSEILSWFPMSIVQTDISRNNWVEKHRIKDRGINILYDVSLFNKHTRHHDNDSAFVYVLPWSTAPVIAGRHANWPCRGLCTDLFGWRLLDRKRSMPGLSKRQALSAGCDEHRPVPVSACAGGRGHSAIPRADTGRNCEKVFGKRA